MFKFILVDFKDVPNKPKFVYSATFYQNRYRHELVEITFRDWAIDYDNVSPGSPVEILLSGVGSSKKFYGYVHHIEPNQTPGTNFTTVTLIGASYVMKAKHQKVYRNTTADQVVKKIAKKHKFVCYVEPHGRVYPQISQSGHSDWEFINRLAKQCGYSVRVENTELYFQPILHDYTEYRETAPIFVMRGAQSVYGSSMYSFKPTIGETIEYEDALKSANAVLGVDLNTSSLVKHTPQKKVKKTKSKSKQDFFDSFDPLAVALNPEVAKFESEATDARNSFPYRATVEVLGNAELKPNYPVYLEGLGKTYSGYWTILSATHKVIEEKRNVYKYTTVLEVGTDSLGSTKKWTDGKTINSPSAVGKRIIKPGVRQTKKKSKTVLKKTSKINSPQLKAEFGSTANRGTTNKSGQSTSPNVWASDSASQNFSFTEKVTSAAVKARISR
jgi:phage protein D